MHQELLAFVIDVGKTFLKGVPISLALALVFTVLTWFWACNPGRPWWRKPTGHRPLLLAVHPGHHPLFAHRHAGRRRRGSVRHHHRRRPDRVL
jgi:hypothetical protein